MPSSITLPKLPTRYDDLKPTIRRAVREEYIRLQKNKCWYCKLDIFAPPPKYQDKPINVSKFPKGFFRHPIHLQHDHDTGLTEGAVHGLCNAVLWEYEGR